MVVATSPFIGEAANLVQGGGDVVVQGLSARGEIEAFDIGVLGG